MNIKIIPVSAGGPTQVPQPQDPLAAVAPASVVHVDPVDILIVDDEPRNLTVLETILDDPRYRLIRAESANQALHVLVSQEFALLILDIRMPGMNGFELAQMIKERKKTAQVPIIFLTAYYSEDQHVLEGYGTGAVDYLHKPVNPAILRSKVAVFAELHWKNRECAISNRALLAEVVERRRAEEQLRELNGTLEQRVVERTKALAEAAAAKINTNERYRSLFDGSIDAIFSLGTNAQFETANRASLRLTARTFEELKTIRFLDLCVPDQREALEKAFHAAFLRQSFSMDTTIALPTGECRELYISGAPALANDEVIGILCIARDITERKQAEALLRHREEALARELSERMQIEERLRQLTATLEDQVKERTMQLETSYARLRALATKLTVAEQTERRRLATELHDYLAQTLVVTRMKVGQLLRQDHDEAVRGILQDADQLLHQSLDYTRTLVSELTPQALYERGLSAAIRWLGDQLHRQQVLTVEVSIDAPVFPLSETEAMLLFHSIRELLFNVLKHAKTDRASVRLSYDQDVLSITVSDSGCGFDVSKLGDDRFGLLSIRERMIALGGCFNLQSEPGKGTVVSLYLPIRLSVELDAAQAAGEEGRPPLTHATIQRPHGPVSAPPSRRTADAVIPLRVMIVDDHEMVREGLRSILTQYADLTVVGEASTGEEALQLVCSLRPDLVLMDMHMPGWDGAESTRRILKERPSTVVIGLSFQTDPHVAQSILDAGAVAFLPKDTIGKDMYSVIQSSITHAVNRETFRCDSTDREQPE